MGKIGLQFLLQLSNSLCVVCVVPYSLDWFIALPLPFALVVVENDGSIPFPASLPLSQGSKSSSQNLSAEALVKVFACLGVQDGPNNVTAPPPSVGASGGGGESSSSSRTRCASASSTTPSCMTSDLHQLNCQQHQKIPKRPKRLSVFSNSLSSFR